MAAPHHWNEGYFKIGELLTWKTPFRQGTGYGISGYFIPMKCSLQEAAVAVYLLSLEITIDLDCQACESIHSKLLSHLYTIQTLVQLNILMILERSY